MTERESLPVAEAVEAEAADPPAGAFAGPLADEPVRDDSGVDGPADADPEEAPPAPGSLQGIGILVGLLLLLALALFAAINMIRPSAFFRVEATTEMLQVTIRPSEASELASLSWDVFGDSIEVNGQLVEAEQVVPGAGSHVMLRRTGSGPLIVDIRAASDTGVAAVLRAADAPVDLVRGFARIVVQPAPDRSYTVPYFGAAIVGDIVRSSAGELLLDGSVSMLGSTMWGRDRFIAGIVPLRMGDDARITNAEGCSGNVSGEWGVGVARVGGGPGMSVVHEARGQALRISRAGGAPTHCFRPSLWSFFSADPLVGGLLLFAAGVLIAVAQNLITLALMGGAGLTHVGRGRLPGRTLGGLPLLIGRKGGKI